MFKTGDFLRGLSGNGYGVTCEDWTGIVVKTTECEPRNSSDDFFIDEDTVENTRSSDMIVLGLNNRDPYNCYTVYNSEGKFRHIKLSECEIVNNTLKRVFSEVDDNSENIDGFSMEIDGSLNDNNKIHSLKLIKKEEDTEEEKEEEKKETKLDKIFDKSQTVLWTDDEKSEMSEEIIALFKEYRDKDDVEYPLTTEATMKMLNISNGNKGWMEYWMTKHPNYNRKSHSIVVTSSFERRADKSNVLKFCEYLQKRYIEYLWQNEKVEPPFSRKEYNEYRTEYDKYCSILRGFDYFPDSSLAIYDGENKDFYKEKYEKVQEKVREYRRWNDLYEFINEKGETFRVIDQSYDRYTTFSRFIDKLRCFTSDRITESEANYINNRCEYYEFARAVKGQKWSTVVKKVAKHFGITEHKDIQTKEWTDETTGEVKSRDVDMGWNKQFTIFCDSIKPITKKMKVVLSVNPYDFFTMSFGSSWASCQTIDKTNKRDGSSNYEGCYSGATTDLAEDGSTLIMYLLPEDYDGTTPYKEDKVKRCLFYMGEDKFVQSRVYPDGRDGTDYTDISKQMREIMENIINVCSENVDKTMWADKEKSNNDFMELFVKKESDALHYADYFEYSDIFVVRNKNVKMNAKRIIIGHEPTCLCCGNTNDRESSVICESCYDNVDDNHVICERCGTRILREDAISINDGDFYYCDSYCAEHDDYYYCVDTDRYEHIDNCFYDDYYGHYYSYNGYHIHTEDGRDFHDEDSADNSRYAATSDGKWYPEDEVFYCERCGSYVHERDWDTEQECCVNCVEEVEEVEEETEE